jgi:hypothetical protein
MKTLKFGEGVARGKQGEGERDPQLSAAVYTQVIRMGYKNVPCTADSRLC